MLGAAEPGQGRSQITTFQIDAMLDLARAEGPAWPSPAKPEFAAGDIVQSVEVNRPTGSLHIGQFYTVGPSRLATGFISIDGTAWRADRFKLIASGADGWKLWPGGEKEPCDPNDVVEFILRWKPDLMRTMRAGSLHWEHRTTGVPSDHDIIAYRIASRAKDRVRIRVPAVTRPSGHRDWPVFTAGQVVTCIDDTECAPWLLQGCRYFVNMGGPGLISLEGMPGKVWKSSRFTLTPYPAKHLAEPN